MNPLRQQSKSPTRSMNRGDSFSSPFQRSTGDLNPLQWDDRARSQAAHHRKLAGEHKAAGRHAQAAEHEQRAKGWESTLGKHGGKLSVQAAPSFSPGLKGKKEDEAYFDGKSEVGVRIHDHPTYPKTHSLVIVEHRGKEYHTSWAHPKPTEDRVREAYKKKPRDFQPYYGHFKAKHADEPGEGAMFGHADWKQGVAKSHHDVLIKHGFKKTHQDHTGTVHTYMHPKTHTRAVHKTGQGTKVHHVGDWEATHHKNAKSLDAQLTKGKGNKPLGRRWDPKGTPT